MKFIIKHELKGRIRLHIVQSRMSYKQADTLLYYLQSLTGVINAKVYERTADATIVYSGNREQILIALKQFHYQDVEIPELG